MCVNIIYVCICLYCVICLILYYRSLLICTNKEFMNKCKKYHPSSLHYDFNNNNNEQSIHSSKSDENQ